MTKQEIFYAILGIIIILAFCVGVYGLYFYFLYKIFAGAYHLLELLINKI